MHIEPGIVHGAKMALAHGTAAAAAGYSLKMIADDLKTHAVPSFVARAALAVVAVLVFFEILPHFPVGVSEVHLILGTTLLLLLGTGPAAIGLAGGLAIQGMFFAPTDLPMYFVNVTTLLVPLFAIHAMARKVLPQGVAFAADRGRGFGDLGQPVGQCREVEPGAPDDDRARAVQQGGQVAQPVANRIGGVAGHVPEQPVRRAGLVRRVGAGGQHAPVGEDLDRVGIHDDPAVAFGDRDRQRRLARGGRPGDQHRTVRIGRQEP